MNYYQEVLDIVKKELGMELKVRIEGNLTTFYDNTFEIEFSDIDKHYKTFKAIAKQIIKSYNKLKEHSSKYMVDDYDEDDDPLGIKDELRELK